MDLSGYVLSVSCGETVHGENQSRISPVHLALMKRCRSSKRSARNVCSGRSVNDVVAGLLAEAGDQTREERAQAEQSEQW